MFGNKVYVDLEIEVDGRKTLQDAHAVAERVHTEMENKFPDIKHVMIHLNPATLTKGAGKRKNTCMDNP